MNAFLSSWYRRVAVPMRAALTGIVLLAGAANRVSAIAGMEGTFEFGADAPWRLEPSKRADGSLEYGAIPIQVTIHDAIHSSLDNILYATDLQPTFQNGHFELKPVRVSIPLPRNLVSLGRLHSIRVTELDSGQGEIQAVEFGLDNLFEIETTTTPWEWPPAPGRSPELHKICRLWKGENPEPFREVSNTSEWHAGLWYVPKITTPGTSVALRIDVVLERDPWPAIKLPISGKTLNLDTSRWLTLRNYVRVYLATDPLPRFDSRWLYGDFHYHSQGTDNEGEAGYNYRGVIRAMGAMGLDFLFATDHASSSEQLVDVDLPPIWNIPSIALGEDGHTLHEHNAKAIGGVVRDMDEQRFALCHETIFATNGANREASMRGYASRWPQGYLSHNVAPQLFLGGEVDAIPEVSSTTIGPVQQTDSWRPPLLSFGAGLSMDIDIRLKPGQGGHPYQLFEPAPEGGSYLIHDFQSLDSLQYYGREHLVYFPSNDHLNIGREQSFVPSLTSKYGGATRRLDRDHNGVPALLPEIERKGVAFVAHHLNGVGGGSSGPEGVPWTTDHMLMKAFRSPSVLGMQFWNEDDRFHTKVCSHGFCHNDADGTIYGGEEYGYERTESLDTDSLVNFIAFLANIFGVTDGSPPDHMAMPLEEVRRGFVTGGASGGLFELDPFDVRHGLWQAGKTDIEHGLHHGAYDWDRMNLRGLNLEANAALKWLPPGQPRKMFMGGGSDAHGDLNYRRAGYFLGTDDANDTAIGKPRNLVFVGAAKGPVLQHVDPVLVSGPPPAAVTFEATNASPTTARVIIPPFNLGYDIRAHTQEQVVNALASGQFCVTDGPAIRVAIDMNNDGAIDDGDIPMGGVLSLSKLFNPVGPGPREGQTVTLLTEVVSTSEFGPILDVDLYVGVHPNGSARPSAVPVEPRVYTTLIHGPQGFKTSDAAITPQISYTSGGRTYVRLKDNYWNGDFLDTELTWNQVPGNPLRYTTLLKTTLHLDRYQVGEGVSADRFFVRAFAKTAGNALLQIPDRYAFSNPVWMLRQEPTLFEPPTISLRKNTDGKLILTFEGICQVAPTPSGPFVDLPNVVSPYVVPLNQAAAFFRSRK